MRLAEFKTRLFIFFAGRLLKWAESIERELDYGQSPPATPVDDSSAVLFAESSRESEAASGPPEHWARLVASGPPKHWLDLIREKAPQLLTPTEHEPLSPEAGGESSGREDFKTETNQEANGPPAGEDRAGERSQPQPLLRARHRRGETKYSSAKAGRSTWLNRLRFQPPATRAEGLEPAYVSNARTRNSDSSPTAGGAAEEGSESTLQQPTLGAGTARDQSPDPGPDKTIAARQTIPWLSGSFRDEQPESDRHPHHQAETESAELPRIHSEPASQESFSNHSIKQSRAEQIATETVKDTRQTARLNTPLERGDTHAASTRARSRNDSIGDHYLESSSEKRATPLRELDRVRGVSFEKREGASSSARVLHQMRVDEPAVELNFVPSWVKKETAETRQVHHSRTVRATDQGSNAPVSATLANRRVRNPPLSSERPVVSVVTSDEQARNEFAPVELTAPTPIESRIESSENVWPTLPPAPEFDIADELAAKEQEAEGLRRLEQEQRGTLWNA